MSEPATLPDHLHAAGCPSAGASGRVERFRRRRPLREAPDKTITGWEAVTVTRCCDCGGQAVEPATPPAGGER